MPRKDFGRGLNESRHKRAKDDYALLAGEKLPRFYRNLSDYKKHMWMKTRLKQQQTEAKKSKRQTVMINKPLTCSSKSIVEDKKGSELTIKTRQIDKGVQISFSDDGLGISEEYRDKIFDPFYTTRGEKGGTGLGLSICHGIVTDHGGNIYVKSTPGKGTTFFIELPVSSDKD